MTQIQKKNISQEAFYIDDDRKNASAAASEWNKIVDIQALRYLDQAEETFLEQEAFLAAAAA